MRTEYDFSKARQARQARQARDVPHLAKRQAETKGKTRITIMLDNVVLEAFRARAESQGVGYQTLINTTLRDSLSHEPITEETLRRILREEISA